MGTIVTISQIILGVVLSMFGYLDLKKPTKWTGSNAENMKEEFEVYGLSEWFMRFVGFLKLLFVTILILSIFFPILVIPRSFWFNSFDD